MIDAVRFPLVLGAISLCSAAGLALSYSLTRDEIRRQEELKKARGLAEVLGVQLSEGQGSEKPWKEFPHPVPKGQRGEEFSVAVAAEAESRRRIYAASGKAQGYSSRIEVVASVDHAIEKGLDAATIQRIKVIKQLETPGLGSNCMDPKFQRQFQALPASLLELVKSAPYRDPGEPGADKQRPAAITGATITSDAVVGAIRQALERVRDHVERQPEPQPPPANP